MKIKWIAVLQNIQETNLPEENQGYHVVLYLNDNEVMRWKLNKLELMRIRKELSGNIPPGQQRFRVDNDAMAAFVANKVGELFTFMEISQYP